MEQNTPEFREKYGYWRDREKRLREVASFSERSMGVEAANQIKHLKAALADLVAVTEIHSQATGNNFARAELEEAKLALSETS